MLQISSKYVIGIGRIQGESINDHENSCLEGTMPHFWHDNTFPMPYQVRFQNQSS